MKKADISAGFFLFFSVLNRWNLESHPKGDFAFVSLVFVTYRIGNNIIDRILRVKVAIKICCVFGEFIDVGSIAEKYTEI